MTLKIGRYTIQDIDNKDWILDNGSCYQVMTRQVRRTQRHIPHTTPIVMSKKQFAELVKQGKIVRYTELEETISWKRRYEHFTTIKAWKFNVEE